MNRYTLHEPRMPLPIRPMIIGDSVKLTSAGLAKVNEKDRERVSVIGKLITRSNIDICVVEFPSGRELVPAELLERW